MRENKHTQELVESLLAENERLKDEVAKLAKENEPVYAFRRKGLDDFCTCDERRYNELAQKPTLFEVKVFYHSPPTAELIEKVERWEPRIGTLERKEWQEDENRKARARLDAIPIREGK